MWNMKKLIFATGLLPVLMAPAAADVKWFVGGGLGYVEPVFSDLIDDEIDEDIWKDDSGTLSVHINGGMRFGAHDKIYNGGVSATLSYMPDLAQLRDGAANPYEMNAELDFTTLYVSYDNYIRISGDSKYRTDFIASIGLGYGWISETLTSGALGLSYDDDAMVAALKVGFGGETIVDGLGWIITANITVPNAKDDADLQASYGMDFGIRYTF